jgi:AcrR family transcriptional regulator
VPDVNGPPRTSLRDERAAVTRNRITGAARSLFRSRGYGATTLVEIAEEAGVAVQTVYAVYRSKPGILRALRESVLRQPEAEALYEQALRESDGDRTIELIARSIRSRWESGADVVAIDRDAASADADVRVDLDAILAIRRAGLARLARSLEGSLTPDIDANRAAAILDAITLPEVYLELVEVHRWPPDEYEAWLSETLQHQLIG